MGDPVADAVATIAGLGDLPASTQRALSDALELRSLRAGETLFELGAPADGIVVVDRGRLGVLGASDDLSDDVIATLGRGELVGELGALTGEPRSSTVIALRDTTVVAIDQRSFDALFDSSPVIARALSRLVVNRLGDTPDIDHRQAIPSVVAIVNLADGASEDALIEALHRRVATAVVASVDLGTNRTSREVLSAIDAIEADSDLVILRAGTPPQTATNDHERAGGTEDSWFDQCLRHADAVIVVVEPNQPTASLRELGDRLSMLRSTVELVVLNPPEAIVGTDAASATNAVRPHRVHQIRRGDATTIDRCARLVMGQGVGLVFSGGAARGLAHLGAWRAIQELGIEIDAVAGVSFGALLGAGVALGYTPDELQDEVQDRLVSERRLVDLTFPWMALLRGERVNHRIADVARGRTFSQTWRDFVCTSCDLTTGDIVEHRTGPLWEAIRSSVSIPGVLPPFRIGDRLLVDGAVRSNLPIAPLRDGHPTPLSVIAIDVGKDGTLPIGDTPDGGAVSGWRLMARRVHPRRATPTVPSMSQLLTRVVDLAGDAGDAVADTVVRPDLRHLGVGDFAQIDNFARAGYDATMETLG